MATEDEQPAPGRLKALRPGAIVTNKGGVGLTVPSNATIEPVTAGGSRGSPSPGVRVSVVNKAGKNREIAKIEPPGTIGDFYDFGSILGQGGFGTVSEILHAKTFQPFAGKVIEKWKSESDIEECEAPFRQVMEVLLNNEHPHVVRMLHVFEDECNYYQVMEACQGGTLRRFVRNFERSDIPVKVVEDILEQVLVSIEFLHNFKIIHRDIKPDNVMLNGPQEAAKILDGTHRIRLNIVDFDMCRFLDSEDEVKSRHLEGTPGFLAPEVLETRRYSCKSDLFAYGCSMYFVMLHEEPCPDIDFDGATCDLISGLGRWMTEALELCTEAAEALEAVEAEARSPSAASGKDGNSPKSPKTAKFRNEDSSPKSPGTRVRPASASPHSNGTGSATGSNSALLEPMYEGFPVRLWRLLAWCLDMDPAKRPASTRAIMLSGYLRGEVASPRSPSPLAEPGTTKREKRNKGDRQQKNKASIDDLLKLTAAVQGR